MNRKTPTYKTATGDVNKNIAPVPRIQEINVPAPLGLRQLTAEIYELATMIKNQEWLLNRTLFLEDDRSDQGFPTAEGIEWVLYATKEVLEIVKHRLSIDIQKLDNEIQ